MFFRAHIYIRSDILGYTPHPGDLSYPEKLEMMESIAESISNHEADQSAQFQQGKVAQPVVLGVMVFTHTIPVVPKYLRIGVSSQVSTQDETLVFVPLGETSSNNLSSSQNTRSDCKAYS